MNLVILMEENEEYELIPINPIRRLEKRLEQIEKVVPKIATEELLNALTTNQKIVDDLVRINTELIAKISALTSATQQLVENFSDFLQRIEVVEEMPSENQEVKEEVSNIEGKKEPDEERLARLEKKLNRLILSRIPKEKWEALRR
jgi:chromosome segregation ATPase